MLTQAVKTLSIVLIAGFITSCNAMFRTKPLVHANYHLASLAKAKLKLAKPVQVQVQQPQQPTYQAFFPKLENKQQEIEVVTGRDGKKIVTNKACEQA